MNDSISFSWFFILKLDWTFWGEVRPTDTDMIILRIYYYIVPDVFIVYFRALPFSCKELCF